MTLADKSALMERASMPVALRREFDRIVKRGNSPSLALAFVSRRMAMMGQSDRAFCEQQQRSMSNIHPKNRDQIVKIAEKAGVRTEGKTYNGELGRYCEQHAWVSGAEDVKTVYKLKNWGSADGMVRHKRVNNDVPRKRQGLAEDLVRERMQKYIKDDPKLQEKVKRKGKSALGELREKVIAKHGRKKRGD